MDTAAKRWLSWNILLKNLTNPDGAIKWIEDSIVNRVKAVNPTYDAKFILYYCPCDSLLYNLAATAIDGSGTAVQPPGTPGAPVAGKGDVLVVSENNKMDEDTVQIRLSEKATSLSNITPGSNEGSKNILGIIDTGFDPALFPSFIKDLIWKPSPGKHEFNFIDGSKDNYFDDHKNKHGSGVAALALHQMDNEGSVRPRLMILKALDKNKHGSTFTVSCALSYAIQNNARVVNASLGYYEMNKKVDSVFRHYIKLCSSATPNSIFIISAAGNTAPPHPGNKLCDSAMNSNELKSSRLFYPACFSDEMQNVITVTGLSSGNSGACFFQNYSAKYVTLGVKNKLTCCSFHIPIFLNNVEGSSFATPIVSGLVMDCLGTSSTSTLSCIQSKTIADSRRVSFTKDGRLMVYDDQKIW